MPDPAKTDEKKAQTPAAGDKGKGAHPVADKELSQAEIEALLAQASELSAESDQGVPPAQPAKSKTQAGLLSDASVFGAATAPVDLSPLEPGGQQERLMSEEQALELLGDVPMDVSIELGKVKLTIGELIALRSGAVISLDRLVGEPVSVLANGTIIARGEVVVVNDYYSVRITEIVDDDH